MGRCANAVVVNVNDTCGQYISMGVPIYCSEDGTSAPPKNIRDGNPTEVFAGLFDAYAAGLHRSWHVGSAMWRTI